VGSSNLSIACEGIKCVVSMYNVIEILLRGGSWWLKCINSVLFLSSEFRVWALRPQLYVLQCQSLMVKTRTMMEVRNTRGGSYIYLEIGGVDPNE